MSLLDIDMTYKNTSSDVLRNVLLNRIREHYQQYINQKFKIISVTMIGIDGRTIELDWNEIFNNSEYWRVYYVQNIRNKWDMEVKFAPYKVSYVSGGRTVKEFIDGNIKPSYLL